MRRMILALLLVGVFCPWPILAQEKTEARDRRLTDKPQHYDLPAYHPWTPPATKEAWEARKPILRTQVLVSQGLWPMPEKTPLGAVVHGKIERDGYTVEKVFFASAPGHYVCGNLYRPTGKAGKRPGVLCPHGHWADGRKHEAKDFASQIKSGAEQTEASAKYPLQARCAMLARLGCIVFHYDMVGYADSKQITHREGFKDVDAQLRLQTFMGLQTWNSIRSLDFLLSQPEVDATRIGVTGASGGGTQTFILCAVDDRPTAAFPAVMVSTAMQGGCICENCAYLRVGTTNIELAALFAPRPLGMSGALDWTRDIEKKGLPELKQIYELYGAPENVIAKAYLQFGHNYNQVSRELMYHFFNRHLKLGQAEPIAETPFTPVAPRNLSVFDAKHPLPNDAVNAEGLKRYLTMAAEKQLQGLLPVDADSLARFRAIEHGALRAMMVNELPKNPVEVSSLLEAKGAPGIYRGYLARNHRGEMVHIELLKPQKGTYAGQCVVWVHPEGLASLRAHGKLVPAAQAILDRNQAILAVEVLRTGASAQLERPTTNLKVGSLVYAGYFYGYNRALVAERVHDILTAVAYAKTIQDTKTVHLVGFEKAGPWVVLARSLCGAAVARTAADLNRFRFEQVKDFDDEMMLPGALKYGGLVTLAGVIAPHELYLHNTAGTGSAAFVQAAYQASGLPGALQRHEEKADGVTVVNWLLR